MIDDAQGTDKRELGPLGNNLGDNLFTDRDLQQFKFLIRLH
jgi:hypothetical protein